MASKVMNYGRFHQKHGTSIRILEDGRVAHRISYYKAVVYSEQPISIGNMFQVKILEYKESWAGSLVSWYSSSFVKYSGYRWNLGYKRQL